MTLAFCIDRRAKYCGGLRALALVSGLTAGYLSRLRSGEKVAPSEETLRALGIERTVTYRLAKSKPRHPPGSEDFIPDDCE